MKSVVVALVIVIAIVLAASFLVVSRRKTAGLPTPVSIPEMKHYPRLTKEILAKTPDDEVEMAVVDYIMNKIGDDYSREAKIVRGLSKGMQMVWTTWNVESEVNNGGFHQYFCNTSGEFADDALAGFRLAGAVKHAELMQQAIRLAAKEKPLRDKVNREGSIQAFSDSYKETDMLKLDDVFYDLENTENLSKLRVRYIRSHPDEFVGD